MMAGAAEGPIVLRDGRHPDGQRRYVASRCRLQWFLICFLTTLPAWAQPAQTAIAETDLGTGLLDLALSPAEITVGDRVEARITLVWAGPEPDGIPGFPTWETSWGEAEILERGEVESLTGPGGQQTFRQNLVLTAFTTGEITLPEITVGLFVGDEKLEIASGDEWGFNVKSVLPDDGADIETRPQAPPRPLETGVRFIWAITGLGAFGLLAAWLLTRRLQVVQATGPAARAEPLPELLNHLMQLDATVTEPAHTGLSLGLRHFLGRSLGFPAAESTTREIDRRLRRAAVSSKIADRTVQLLLDCDQVKFAREPVTADVTRGRLRQARDLGYQIHRGLRPDPATPTHGGQPGTATS